MALVLAAILPVLDTLAGMWTQEEYSHAWLIPPLAVLIFLQRLPGTIAGGSRRIGLPVVILALLLLLAGWATRNTTLSVYGLIAALFGLTLAAFGTRAMRRLSAPIAFLVFMIPLPLAVYISVSQSMQLMSSKLGVALMGLFGVVVFRDGNVIELANGRLQIAEACNGLRYLFPLLSIGFLLATLMEDRVWKKAVLFLSALPIAIGLNALRVALIGVLVDRYGISMAEGTQHEVEGFVVFALCVLAMLGVVHLLLRIGARGRFPDVTRLIPDRRAVQALAAWPSPLSFRIVSILLAAGALGLINLPTRSEAVPERRPLALFPMTLDGWSGSPQPLDQATLGALALTDYVVADYVDPERGDTPVNFYVAYYASQRIGVQVHSPRLCIPGGGWAILDQSITDVPVADGSVARANRVVIAKGRLKQIVYYWFEERGRRLTDETEIKLYALVDAVRRNRSDGALVRFVTPVIGDDEAEADRNLQGLALAATTHLRAFVPD